ncbi:hypothetical protein BDFG_01041 [Blastomyces dermatitidis ATCC 26199]|nr:hypothetical protein BDFG_01041 [Blastomyces dermatitidis ATCC 26199]
MKTANADDTPGTSSAFKGTDYPPPPAVDAEKHCASASSCSSGPGSEKSISITALPPIIDENPHPHHPLFPPLPEYKPPSIFTAVQWRALRAVSFCLSLIFLIGIVLAASVSSSLIAAKDLSIRLRGGDPEKDRPFWQEECQRRDARESAAWVWDDEKRKLAAKPSVPRSEVDAEERSVGIGKAPYEPLEGGQDPLTPKADGQSHPANGGRKYPVLMLPPMALWVAGLDQLTDGSRLLRRLKGRSEPYVRVVHSRVIEEYEHLDVIWTVDSIEKVGMEVRRVIWECVKDDARDICRYPEV